MPAGINKNRMRVIKNKSYGKCCKELSESIRFEVIFIAHNFVDLYVALRVIATGPVTKPLKTVL